MHLVVLCSQATTFLFVFGDPTSTSFLSVIKEATPSFSRPFTRSSLLPRDPQQACGGQYCIQTARSLMGEMEYEQIDTRLNPTPPHHIVSSHRLFFVGAGVELCSEIIFTRFTRDRNLSQTLYPYRVCTRSSWNSNPCSETGYCKMTSSWISEIKTTENHRLSVKGGQTANRPG
jgi:hypothetical protein